MPQAEDDRVVQLVWCSSCERGTHWRSIYKVTQKWDGRRADANERDCCRSTNKDCIFEIVYAVYSTGRTPRVPQKANAVL